MKKHIRIFQVAMVFIGSIVGAGLSSGRELNQFFSVFGYKSLIGLGICALLYIIVGKMIVEISSEHKTQSYSEFVALVCTKKIGIFTNITLTLFLISSTSIILAGSSAVIQQFFHVPKWIGLVVMIGCSVIFLLRKTEGLFEVNSIIVPCLLIVLTLIFVGIIKAEPTMMTWDYITNLPPQKQHFLPSSLIYASFNIISIIGILVPLSHEIKDKQVIVKGVALGSMLLTIISFFIVIMMIVHSAYPKQFEIPILAVAATVGRRIQLAMMGVIWLEMFSSQISNIYSLTRSMETQFHIPYKQGIFLVLIIAMPFSLLGFSNLVEVLYPIYGVLSLLFVGSCISFYMKKRISVNLSKKNKQKMSYMHRL